jgi:hypothetical protein
VPSFIFDSADGVVNFLSAVQRDQDQGMLDEWMTHRHEETVPTTQGAGTTVPGALWDAWLSEGDGYRHPFSNRQKETRVYNYNPQLFRHDFRYLENRDPTAQMIIHEVPKAVWAGIPSTGQNDIDTWLTRLVRLGYLDHSQAAQSIARRDGSSFLFWRMTGNLDEPASRGDDVVGFDVINQDQVENVKMSTSTNKLIARDRIGQVQLQDDETTTIHGSRLELFKEDKTVQDWLGRPKLMPIYDDIWNLRDILYSQTHQQFEGNALQVTVDDKALERNITLGENEKSKLRSNLGGLISGHNQIIDPVEGITIERIGAADLPDPREIINALVARISNATEFTKSQIASVSTGANLEEIDRDEWDSAISTVRSNFASQHIQHAVTVGKVTGEVPSAAELPVNFRWPESRHYNLRELAYVFRSSSMALEAALRWGRQVPPEIEDFFPDDPDRDPIPRVEAGANEVSANEAAASREDRAASMHDRNLEMLMEELNQNLEEVSRKLDESSVAADIDL